MPIVTAPSRGQSNGETITEFLDTVSTTPTTYTFQNTQEKLKVKNNGYGSVQLTVNGTVVTVLPTESKEFYGNIDSFIMVSSGGVQSFEVTGSNYKDEEIQLTGSDLQENPSHTNEGQQAISIAEPFWVRMSREGMMAQGWRQGEGITNTYSTRTGLLLPSKGRRLYLARISVSSSVSARATIQITGLNYARQDSPTTDSMIATYFDTFFIRPYECKERVYSGELWLEEGMSLDIKYHSLVTSETGIMDFSAMGWEVAASA